MEFTAHPGRPRPLPGLIAALLWCSPLLAGTTPVWTDVTLPLLSGDGQLRSAGAAWGDYDDDGRPDLYVTHLGPVVPGPDPGSPNQLFRNIGGDLFAEISGSAADLPGTVSFHPAWGDYNNDGRLDLYVGSLEPEYANLIRNDGHGLFVEATNGEPLAMVGTIPRGVTWIDYDQDGLLDLYVSNSKPGQFRNRLMRNVNGRAFFWVTQSVLEDSGREGRGAAWADFNNDGLPDLYVVNGAEGSFVVDDDERITNSLFVNLGGGVFEEVGAAAGVADTGHGRGVAWGDYDNDGFFDLFVANKIGPTVAGTNRLYRNHGDGTFTDVAEEAGVSENEHTRCVSWVDFDNDGWLDIYVVNFGSTPGNRLYHNQGDGTFLDVAPGTPIEAPLNGQCAAWADYNGDGRVDVFTVGGDGANQLLRNDTASGHHWLEVRLRGGVSNRAAIGARLTVVTGEESRIREVHSGSGYKAQHMLTAHFGLGGAEIVDALEIRWPSGLVEVLEDVPVNQRLDIEEGCVSDNPLAEDCNGNAIPDLCEVDFGISEDCNGNGVPDSCDVAGGDSLDRDGNGIPDECQPPSCPADVSGDGTVTVADLIEVLLAWGTADPSADVNQDGVVDVQDMNEIILNWGAC